MTTRAFVAKVLDPTSQSRPLERVVNTVLVILIILNVAASIFSTMHDFYLEHKVFFDWFEWISLAIFTVEYLLRLWSTPENMPHLSASKSRLKWFLSPAALIDLLAILPGLLHFLIPIDLRVLRILRLLRLLKLNRHSDAINMLLAVIAAERKSFFAAVSILFVLMVVAASGAYVLESKVQPENFGSIPEAMWWAVATLTTVGYGDVTPMTPLGKVFGALVTLFGIGMAALPAGILASGFGEQIRERKQQAEEDFYQSLLNKDVSITDRKAIQNLRKTYGISVQQGLALEERAALALQAYGQESNANQSEAHTQCIICPHCHKSITPDTPQPTTTHTNSN